MKSEIVYIILGIAIIVGLIGDFAIDTFSTIQKALMF